MNDRFREIPALIRKTKDLLLEMISRIDKFEEEIIPKIGKTEESVFIPVQILENGYTAMETLFLRISQAFENNLDSKRWHADLLEKMTLEIAGIRPRVISDESYRMLVELLRFRHFKRYYFELTYDWRKVDYLVVIFREMVPRIHKELSFFEEKLLKSSS